MTAELHGTEPAFRGEVVYMFAFDVAYELRRAPLSSLLGCPLAPAHIDSRKHAPKGQTFYRPLTAQLPALSRTIAGRLHKLRAAVRVLPVGAISFVVRIPFTAASLPALHSCQAPVFDDGQSLEQWVLETADSARRELAVHAVRPRERLLEGESYTVFCLDAGSPGIGAAAGEWLESARPEIAALLTREPDAAVLSRQEIAESTRHSLSYYRHDLAVVDWDAALLVDEPGSFDESLYVLELANLQLEELKAYDSFIDEALERAYQDLSTPRMARRRGILRGLKEIRIDLARFSDELSNITKFFGEWHLARVYENAARVFHLADWHRGIDEKLRTLDSLYEMLKQDHNHRVMLWLEAGIVVLFIIDIVMLFAGLSK